MDLGEDENDLLDRIMLYVSKDIKSVSVDSLLQGLTSAGSTVDKDWIIKTLENPAYQSIIGRIDNGVVYLDKEDENDDDTENYEKPTEKEKHREQVSKMANRQLASKDK
jgi:hypothetical protein